MSNWGKSCAADIHAGCGRKSCPCPCHSGLPPLNLQKLDDDTESPTQYHFQVVGDSLLALSKDHVYLWDEARSAWIKVVHKDDSFSKAQLIEEEIKGA